MDLWRLNLRHLQALAHRGGYARAGVTWRAGWRPTELQQLLRDSLLAVAIAIRENL